MKITTVGLDLAKSVFQIHGVDERRKAVLRKQLKRSEMVIFFTNLPPCLIGMEACASAHHWARKLMALGHEVRLMAPQFVKPYVKTNKNDRNDAEAICEAVARPNMRFVPVKTPEQQTVLALRRVLVCVAGATRAPPWKTLATQFLTYQLRNSVQSIGATSLVTRNLYNSLS
jgi:transposase